MIKLPQHYYQPNCYWAQMLTFRCNALCEYCILNRRGTHVPRPDEMSGKQVLNFWNNLEHNKGQRLSLIGGEPTLHKDFIEIVNGLENYAITMTTNCKTPFIANEEYKKLNPKPSSTLRINTTFHPHHITAEEYISVVNKLGKTGYFVDQTSYVLYPDFPGKYRQAVKRVAEEIDIYDSPYMGFWSKEKGFDAEPCPGNNEPDESYQGRSNISKLCGITSLKGYRDIAGQSETRQAICQMPMHTLIIDPEGTAYPCHYRLYYAREEICHIDDFRSITQEDTICNFYGFCNHCDVNKIACIENPTASPIPGT